MPELSDESPQLDPDCCRQRQQRLIERMRGLGIDRAVVLSPENVHYLTGHLPHRLLPAVAALEADGRCILCAPVDVVQSDETAADEIIPYEAQRHATLRQERTTVAYETLAGALKPVPRDRLGLERSRAPGLCGGSSGERDSPRDIEPELWRLRRRKDPDELAMIANAIRCTERMYEVAREIVAPGVSELDMFGRLHAAAVECAGEPLTAFGNDFQCGSIGGPPRRRTARAGELYILDLGAAVRGYYADMCRTFAVDRRATDSQRRVWEVVVSVLGLVEATVRPGVSCREVYSQAKECLDAHLPGGFIHHLGHGIGLEPHEAPHLNPYWDDVFEIGDVFTAEPGLYGGELNAGLRLEQVYRVTQDGIERLTSFPLDL